MIIGNVFVADFTWQEEGFFLKDEEVEGQVA